MTHTLKIDRSHLGLGVSTQAIEIDHNDNIVKAAGVWMATPQLINIHMRDKIAKAMKEGSKVSIIADNGETYLKEASEVYLDLDMKMLKWF